MTIIEIKLDWFYYSLPEGQELIWKVKRYIGVFIVFRIVEELVPNATNFPPYFLPPLFEQVLLVCNQTNTVLDRGVDPAHVVEGVENEHQPVLPGLVVDEHRVVVVSQHLDASRR